MEQKNLLNELPKGFDNWLDLYKYIKKNLNVFNESEMQIIIYERIYKIHVSFLKQKCFDEIMSKAQFSHRDINNLKFSSAGYGGTFTTEEKTSIEAIYKLLHSLV